MGEPLAYFLTWTTYGTWLPGDARGWVDRHCSGPGVPFQRADFPKESAAWSRLKDPPVTLDLMARRTVDAALHETCGIKGWPVHALDVRSNHVHVIVTAPGVQPGFVLNTLKGYGTRALKELYPQSGRERWWTEGGSKRYLNDERSLLAAIQYVRDQDLHDEHIGS